MSGLGSVGFGLATWPPQQANSPKQPSGDTAPGQQAASGPQQEGQNPGTGQKPAADSPQMAKMMEAAEIRASQIKATLFARDAHVRAHEAAHQSAAGHLAGGINLDFKTTSIPKPDGTVESVTSVDGGSVPISMPGVPNVPPNTPEGRAKLEQVQADLTLAQAGAEAPGASDMSAADSAIAAKAASGLGAVSALLNQAEDKPPGNNPFQQPPNPFKQG